MSRAAAATTAGARRRTGPQPGPVGRLHRTLPAVLAVLAPLHAHATDITLWHAWRGEERAVLEAVTADYQAAHPGDHVELVAVPYEALANKLDAAVPRGNGPDLFIYAHEKLGDWVATGLVRPVGHAPPDGPAEAALTREGAQYGWPLAQKSLVLFYNRALLPEPPRTTDALLEAAARLHAPDADPPRWGWASESTSAYQAAAWMHGFGGGIFANDAAPDAVALDRPANRAAFDFLQRLSALGPAEPSGALVTELFNAGRVAMVPNGPWFLGELKPRAEGGPDWAVATLPVVSATGAPAAPWMTVDALFLAAGRADDPAKGALADDFAAYLRSPAVARRRALEGRQVVPGVTVDDPVLDTFAAQTAVPMPTTPAMAQTWEPMARALRRLIRGAATPGQAAAEAETTYRIVSRPAPPSVDPRPWAAAFGLALLAAVAWAARGVVRARAWQDARTWLWVAPGALAVLALVAVPFLVGASVSLFEVEGSAADGSWRFVGVHHFLDILLARDFPLTSASTRALSFWYTLGVTMVWTATNVVLHVTLGVALALLLREPWVRMRGFFRAVLILPWAIPNYITALAWKGMFHQQFGAVNALLGLCGVAPVSWFARWSTAFTANVVTNTWLGFPFMLVVTLGALQSIPREVEEAAEMDGATGFQRFRLVTLPMLKPALLPAVVMGSVWTFNMFNVIYLVSGGEPDGSTDILVSQAYRWAFTRGHRYGYGAAYAVILFGVMLVQSRLLERVTGRKRA